MNKYKIYDCDMRDVFFDELYTIARKDPKVMLLVADMGAHSLERFKKDLPKQYINVGIAEQNMVSLAAGLALGGKKVFIYTIIPFVTMRCYEQIKSDLSCMNLPVVLVGVGPGLTYGGDGPTHHAVTDIALMRALPGMTIFNPCDALSTQAFARLAYKSSGPCYVRIDKGKLPQIYRPKSSFSGGVSQVNKGRDILIISSGVMVHCALSAAAQLKLKGLSAGVADLYRIKPLNAKKLIRIISHAKRVVTLEEHSVIGGIGSIVSELIADYAIPVSLKRIALPDEHTFASGSRECLLEMYGLGAQSIINTIRTWIVKPRVKK